MLTEGMLFFLFLQMIFFGVFEKPKSDTISLILIPKSLFLNITHSLNSWNTVFLVCYTMIWYSSTYFLCVTLKYWLSDSLCHTQPNSVSGHYNFHIFYGLSALYLLVSLKRDPRTIRHYFSVDFLQKLFTPKYAQFFF
jgi:hypothetical protein